MTSLLRRRRLVAAALGAPLVGLPRRPARAVVILDSTWRAEGGRPGHEDEGFGAHEALARRPEFASLMALSEDEGETWDTASGSWIGNDTRAAGRNQGLVLTAAHNFEPGQGPDNFLYRSTGGTVRQGIRLDFHPLYNRNNIGNSGGSGVANPAQLAKFCDNNYTEIMALVVPV